MTPTIPCVKCQSSGLDVAMEAAKLTSGVLLPLCSSCRGSGIVQPNGAPQLFRAAWIVGGKYLVRLACERRKGGFVELDLDWSPSLPPAKGRGRLRPSEKRDYERGRDDALRQHMHEMGGGDFSIVAAGDRH